MTEPQNIARFNYFLILILWVTATTYGVIFEFYPSLYSGTSPSFHHFLSLIVSIVFTIVLVFVLEKLPIKSPEEHKKGTEIPREIIMAVGYKNIMGLLFILISTVMAISGSGILFSFIAVLLMAAAISILMNAYYQERSAMKLKSLSIDYIWIILIFAFLGLTYVATEPYLATLNNGDVQAIIIKLILGSSFGFFSTIVNHHSVSLIDQYVKNKLKADKNAQDS
jgi:hypothetical protein